MMITEDKITEIFCMADDFCDCISLNVPPISHSNVPGISK